jgi:hypothetical protein
MKIPPNTCVFCKDKLGAGVRYAVRHYAHYACYLDAGKRLGDLADRQVLRFPLELLKKRDLLDEWCAAAQRKLEHYGKALEEEGAAHKELWFELQKARQIRADIRQALAR